MIKINMNYFIWNNKKAQIINRRKYVNLNICSVDVLSEKLETKVKSSIRKEILIDSFFLKKRNVLAIIVSMFYWIMCWLFCNNCHSILLAHYPNEYWDVMSIYSLAVRITFRVLDEPSALWDEIAAIFVWEKF